MVQLKYPGLTQLHRQHALYRPLFHLDFRICPLDLKYFQKA